MNHATIAWFSLYKKPLSETERGFFTFDGGSKPPPYIRFQALLFAGFVNCYGNRAVCADRGVVAHVEMMGLIEVDKATGFFKRKSSLPKRKRAFGFINLVRNGGRNPSVIFGL